MITREEEGNKFKDLDEEVVNEEERNDTVEDGRFFFNYIYIIDEENNFLCIDSRRGSCRSLFFVREITENGWDFE